MNKLLNGGTTTTKSSKELNGKESGANTQEVIKYNRKHKYNLLSNCYGSIFLVEKYYSLKNDIDSLSLIAMVTFACVSKTY